MMSQYPAVPLVGCLALAVVSCGGDPGSVENGTDTATSSGQATESSPQTETVGPNVRAPMILDAPEVGRPGGLVYVMVDMPISEVEVALRGVVLPLESALLTDVAGGLYRVPRAAAVGPAALQARRRDYPPAADAVDIEIVQARFVDIAKDVGLGLAHNAQGSPPQCAESHTGVAWGDYDDDGLPDLFIGNVGSGGQLHHNGGDPQADGLPEFVDVTEAVGLGGVDSVAMAEFIDWDGDGDLDLFVGRRGVNRLFANRMSQTGEAFFDDVTAAVGLDHHSQRTMGVAFGDYDRDGDLDLYVVNHAYCFPQAGSEIRAEDHLYRNDDGVFVETTDSLDSPVIASVGFSASWIDVDRDGDQDLVVINDDVGGAIGDPNALWRNDGAVADGWAFTDVSEESGVAIPRVNGMGLALADVNGDGFVDMAFSNIGPNVLLLGDGAGGFTDVSNTAGITRGTLPWDRSSITWAPHLFDHDNDGDIDLYFSGGRIKGTSLVPDAFFDNVGGGRFEELTWAAGVEDVAPGKASALVDFDRDGDWDIATTAWGGAFRLYQNLAGDGSGNHFVDIELRGRGGNAAAIGAIVELTAQGQTQTCFHTNRPALGGGGETTCHFGLGRARTIEAVWIAWPDGSTEAMAPPSIDARIRYEQR